MHNENILSTMEKKFFAILFCFSMQGVTPRVHKSTFPFSPSELLFSNLFLMLTAVASSPTWVLANDYTTHGAQYTIAYLYSSADIRELNILKLPSLCFAHVTVLRSPSGATRVPSLLTHMTLHKPFHCAAVSSICIQSCQHKQIPFFIYFW